MKGRHLDCLPATLVHLSSVYMEEQARLRKEKVALSPVKFLSRSQGEREGALA